MAARQNQLGGFEPYAIAARDKDRADAFAEKYKIQKAYGSYEELVNDPEVEMIYIGTVNSTHADLAKLCINAGKPCLVEKPFSYNAVTSNEVLKLAAEKNVFCSEAMWLRYQPLMGLLVDLIHKRKIIGPVKYVSANLGMNLRDKERLTNLEYAGGVLLDLGIYPLTATIIAIGDVPASVASAYSRLNSGVDAIDTIQMNFKNGAQASVFTTMMTQTDNRVYIYGAGGRIEVDGVNYPTEIRLYNVENKMVQAFNPPESQLSGYEYEFIAAREAVITGKIDTPQHNAVSIMQMVSFMDMLRRAWHVVYPLPGEPDPESLKGDTKLTPAENEKD